MRLWIRLTLFLVTVSVVPLLVTGLQAVQVSSHHAMVTSEEQLFRDAAVRAELVGRWTADQARFLHGWTQLYPSRLAQMGPELQDGLLKAVYVAMPSAVVVALVDVDGLPVVPPRYATTAGDRPAADRARAERLVAHLPITAALAGGAHIGDPYVATPGEPPSVPVAVLAATPPEDDEGFARPEDTLLLGAEISLEVVHEIVTAATPQLGYALLDGSGIVLAGADHPLVRPRLVRALAGTSARFRYALEDGEEVIGAVAPVPSTDWSIVVVRPATLVAGPARQIRARTLALVSLSVATALFLGYLLSQSLLDPVERLRDAALAVADGEYGRRASIDRGDELGELARAFDHMSERLRANQREIEAQQDEIAAFNRELQDRVERRTAELRSAQAQLVRSGQLAAVAEIGAGLAHELNNPLAGILGLTQLLRARQADGPDARLLGDIEAQAERCREVVETLVRLSSGEVDPSRAPVVDLRDVLREVANLVRGPFRQRGVNLQLVEHDVPLQVRLDPVHGSRILAQILNALRAGLAEGATLRVSTRVDEPGAGDVQVLLEPDAPVAVDEARRDDLLASGLGLWVARRLLHELGGRLDQLVEDGGIGASASTTPGPLEDDPVPVAMTGGHLGTPGGAALSTPPSASSRVAWRVVLPGA